MREIVVAARVLIVIAHKPRNPLASYRQTLVAKFAGHPLAPVSAIRQGVCRPDMGK
ncbi:hypothetical protein Aam_066_004 [Acidocella aminolytica 101 = DSM 11237]|uniref:Uncharacterized protein n=1 Tax=Acidocella aminolytica 101 = DSM 11237 TaxID=1120923 RepID=A0A0D6PGP3_9PROT|nr:hypothetical protein Aam_066_004 [Acidocella aminolytica 101 = DSM 11237]GBQ43305.1 hypothetical protein AA11237_3241 [Acidocella aminolytica 101 = DSM 11237]